MSNLGRVLAAVTPIVKFGMLSPPDAPARTPCRIFAHKSTVAQQVPQQVLTQLRALQDNTYEGDSFPTPFFPHAIYKHCILPMHGSVHLLPRS